MTTRILAGRYELTEKIGEGGMAVVFRARDLLLNRPVAVKILRPEYTKDVNFINGFRRESKLAACITSPNIVNVYDVGRENNIYYIVMELVEGEPLSDIIKNHAPLEPRRAANIARQIAMALSTAHRHNLIHRDVKPHNVLVSAGDVAKISDFGIAVIQSQEESGAQSKNTTVMGSVHYFSPEQARGAYVDERSDIYSLGIVLYEMLTGKVPFDGDSVVDIALKQMNEPMVPPSIHNPSIPKDLEEIVMKASAKLQTERYPTADDMITALSLVNFSKPAVNPSKPPEPEESPEEKKARIREEKKRALKKKRIRAAAIAGAVVAAIVILTLLLRPGEPRPRQIAVPNVLTMSYEEAAELLAGSELEAALGVQIISKEPAGTVLSQTPESGTPVSSGQVVSLAISRGETDNSVPLLKGLTQSSAKAVLENYGYVLGEVSPEYSSLPKGTVISQDPALGSKAAKGSSVKIVISAGPKEQ